MARLLYILMDMKLGILMENVIENVVLLDSSLGGREEFLAALSRLTGGDSPDNINIFENPVWDEINDLKELGSDQGGDIVISPSMEMNEIPGSELSIVELGSPSFNKHLIYQMPYLGYEGAVALAQRILDASTRRY